VVDHFTPNLGLKWGDHGDYAATGWDATMNADFNILDTAFGGTLNLSLSGGTYNMSQAEASNPVILLSGTLSSDQILTFPALAGRRIIIPSVVMSGHILYVRGNGGTDTNGIYFWQNAPTPYGIVITPSRVYWDYGQIPLGTIIDVPHVGFVGNGWLPCDGRYVSQTLHDLLYAAIGAAYGTSGGNFKLPDYRGMIMACADNLGAIINDPNGGHARGILNSWGVMWGSATVYGAANNTIAIGNMPAHNHPGSVDTGHSHGASQAAHSHGLSAQVLTPAAGPNASAGGGWSFNTVGTTAAQPAVTVNTGNAAIAVAAQGGGSPLNNVQPTQTIVKMMKW